MMELHVLSAGAAKGLVDALAPDLELAAGATLRGEFGAVGAIKERWLGGAPCDVIILTHAMLDALARDGRVVPETITPLGRVRTGIAVRVGEALPAIADREELRQSLATAKTIYLPDPERSTAGVHFIKVLRELAIHDVVASRLHAFPNGAIAMRELGQSREPGQIGCTQITEINYTPGVVLVGPLPTEFELATVYAVGVATSARQPAAARRVVQMLSEQATRELRRKGGFEV